MQQPDNDANVADAQSTNNDERFISAQGDQVIHHRRLRERRGWARRAPRLTLSMTAMIDVVFLLLVYFLLATDFRVGEEMYRLDLPDRSTEAQRDPFRLEEEPLRIFISSTGLGPDRYRLRVAGGGADGLHRQPETFEQLHDFLRNSQVSADNASGLFAPDHPVVIHPSHATRWEHAVEALNAAARARYANVTFAAPG